MANLVNLNYKPALHFEILLAFFFLLDFFFFAAKKKKKVKPFYNVSNDFLV